MIGELAVPAAARRNGSGAGPSPRVVASTAVGIGLGVAGALLVGYEQGFWAEVALIGCGIAGFLLAAARSSIG